MATRISFAWAALLFIALASGSWFTESPWPIVLPIEAPAGLKDIVSQRGTGRAYGSAELTPHMAHRTAQVPHTIEEMGQITEPSSFEYTTPAGAGRVRMIYPMRGCMGNGLAKSSGDRPALVSPDPDNPWFVLAYPRCGPPGANCGGVVPSPAGTVIPAPPGMYVYATPPYLLSGPATSKPPNPDNPSANPYHSNIVRHWANMTPDNPVQVIIACRVASGAAGGTDIFAANPLPPAPAGVAVTYTRQQFSNHIQATIAAFTGCNTAAVWVNTTAAFTDTSPFGYSVSAAYTAYDPAPGPLATPAPLSVGGAGQLIWDYSVPPTPLPPILPSEPNNNGPTGNGFNEILFLQNRPLGNGGFCSMDLDPATGAIIECDVAFDVSSYAAGAPSPGLPNETTAFRHEIGHFFGLDHTNLQPGTSNYGPPTSSWMGFTNPLSPVEVSGMLGVIRRFPLINMIGQLLHPDDAAGLSRLYPVQVPAPNPNPLLRKDPLINTTATIRGAVLKSGAPLFGSNVFVLARPWGTSGQSSPPELDYPRVGTISGTARLTPSDVVGAVNTASGRGTGGASKSSGFLHLPQRAKHRTVSCTTWLPRTMVTA